MRTNFYTTLYNSSVYSVHKINLIDNSVCFLRVGLSKDAPGRRDDGAASDPCASHDARRLQTAAGLRSEHRQYGILPGTA